MRLVPKESDVQMAIIQAFAAKHRIVLYATDAGGRQTRRFNQIPVMMTPNRGLLRLLGVPETLPFGIGAALMLSAGFTDLLGTAGGLTSSGSWRLLFLEVKKPGEKPKPHQIQFMDARRREGHLAFWADSVDSALKQFEERVKP